MFYFNSILGRSSKDLLKNLIYSEYDSQSFYRVAKQYYALHPNASDEDVYDYFKDLFIRINYEIVNLPITKIATLKYNTCKYLNRNDTERKKTYDKVIREEERKGTKIYSDEKQKVYTSNRLNLSRLLMLEAIKEIRDGKATYSDEERKQIENFFKQPKKYQSKHKNTLDKEGKLILQELKDLFDGDELEKCSNLLRKYEPALEKSLKESYIYSITTLGNRFKQFGLLDAYCKRQDRLFERMGIKSLSYPLKKEHDESMGVEDLFNEENLKKLSLDKLSMINAFWVNRFTKEIETMNKAFFITKKLGLLEKIKEAVPEGNMGYFRVEIDEDDLKSLYTKMNFLHETVNVIFKEFGKGKYETVEEELKNNGERRIVRKIQADEILNDLQQDIGEEYHSYFSQMQPDVKNEFLSDMEDYRIMENARRNTYRAKDMNIIAILSNLHEGNFSSNWGIIPEKNPKNAKMILLAVDLEGLNMPIRLHVEKSLVQDFLKGYQNNTLFPVYQGNKDFEFEGTFISTSILMPLCKKQKDAIEEMMQKPNQSRKNLIEHIAFLVDGTYPEHLKVEKISKKKGKVKISKKIPPRVYIDLSTGEEFVENKGELTKKEIIINNHEGR